MLENQKEKNTLAVEILEGTLKVFEKKGIKFTMDDIAKELSISKKTIYKEFHDKNEMFLAMVDYLFDRIKESKRQVMEDDSLDLLAKIRKMLSVMPESYKNVSFEKLFALKEKYPEIYEQVELRLESGWEETMTLLELGKAQGVIRDVNLPMVKVMMESTLEQFFRRDILIQNHMGYQEGLTQIVDILIDGIKA